jgi:hypothetical protein
MGLFVIIFSIAVVIIQATSMLLGRDANKWSFWLLESSPNITHIPDIELIFKAINDDYKNYNNNNMPYIGQPNSSNIMNHSANSSVLNRDSNNISTLSADSTLQLIFYLFGNSSASKEMLFCIQSSWTNIKSSSFPVNCFFNNHFEQTITTVVEPWNPHLILLTLCCIQTIVCISRIQHKRETILTVSNNNSNGSGDTRTSSVGDGYVPYYNHLHLPLSYAIAIVGLLITIIAILQGLKDVNLVQYPTILTMVFLLGSCIWYIILFDKFGHDITWAISFHLQLVSVPLAVLAIATMGARMWVDVLGHVMLLSSGVNCMWLQSTTQNISARRVSHLLTIFLPTLSIYLAHMQWGPFDDWRYVIAMMACGSLAPLYFMAILFNTPDNDFSNNGRSNGVKSYSADTINQNKIFNKITFLCTNAALLSMVVNLALF